MIKIKELCTEKGITINELAKLIDIHPQSLSRIISTGNTRKETLEKIAKALNVQVSELYGEQNSNTIYALDQDEWSILKIITIAAPTKYGLQDVAYFMYKRPLSQSYKVNASNQRTSLCEEYPRQKDFPQDEIDIHIIKAIQNKYPESRVHNKLILFNIDRDYVNRLMDPPSEEGQITITPFVFPDALSAQRAYYGYRLPISLYKNFLDNSYQKHFHTSYDTNLYEDINKQESTLTML